MGLDYNYSIVVDYNCLNIFFNCYTKPSMAFMGFAKNHYLARTLISIANLKVLKVHLGLTFYLNLS